MACPKHSGKGLVKLVERSAVLPQSCQCIQELSKVLPEAFQQLQLLKLDQVWWHNDGTMMAQWWQYDGNMMAQSRCHLLSIKAVPGTPSPQLAEEDLATLTGQHQPCPGRPPNHPSHGWPYDDHFRIETYGDLLGIPHFKKPSCDHQPFHNARYWNTERMKNERCPNWWENTPEPSQLTVSHTTRLDNCAAQWVN